MFSLLQTISIPVFSPLSFIKEVRNFECLYFFLRFLRNFSDNLTSSEDKFNKLAAYFAGLGLLSINNDLCSALTFLDLSCLCNQITIILLKEHFEILNKVLLRLLSLIHRSPLKLNSTFHLLLKAEWIRPHF